MPNKDGTGPDGQGPKTGRGCGDCEPKDEKVEVKPRRACRPRRRCCGC